MVRPLHSLPSPLLALLLLACSVSPVNICLGRFTRTFSGATSHDGSAFPALTASLTAIAGASPVHLFDTLLITPAQQGSLFLSSVDNDFGTFRNALMDGLNGAFTARLSLDGGGELASSSSSECATFFPQRSSQCGTYLYDLKGSQISTVKFNLTTLAIQEVNATYLTYDFRGDYLIYGELGDSQVSDIIDDCPAADTLVDQAVCSAFSSCLGCLAAQDGNCAWCPGGSGNSSGCLLRGLAEDSCGAEAHRSVCELPTAHSSTLLPSLLALGLATLVALGTLVE